MFGRVTGASVKLLTMPRLQRVALLRAGALAGLVEVGLHTLALPALAALLGVRVGRSARVAKGTTRPTADELQHIVRVVDALYHRWPPKSVCLKRSLVLGAMLRRHGPELRIGVASRDGRVAAHAWIEIAGVPLPEMEPTNLGEFSALR